MRSLLIDYWDYVHNISFLEYAVYSAVALGVTLAIALTIYQSCRSKISSSDYDGFMISLIMFVLLSTVFWPVAWTVLLTVAAFLITSVICKTVLLLINFLTK